MGRGIFHKMPGDTSGALARQVLGVPPASRIEQIKGAAGAINNK
jgi:hypothetical protein